MNTKHFLVVGLGLLTFGTANAQNLLVNGGFETGDLTGWTNTGSDNAFATTNPVHSGNYSCKLTPGTSDNIVSQSFATTVGGYYDFSVWLINTGRAGDDSDFDNLYWDGVVIPGEPTFVPGDSAWHNYSFTLQATSTTSSIGIEAYNPSGNYFVDDVSVMATTAPEPVSMTLLTAGAVALLRRARRRA